jgi:hypothetical protein
VTGVQTCALPISDPFGRVPKTTKPSIPLDFATAAILSGITFSTNGGEGSEPEEVYDDIFEEEQEEEF